MPAEVGDPRALAGARVELVERVVGEAVQLAGGGDCQAVELADVVGVRLIRVGREVEVYQLPARGREVQVAAAVGEIAGGEETAVIAGEAGPAGRDLDEEEAR